MGTLFHSQTETMESNAWVEVMIFQFLFEGGERLGKSAQKYNPQHQFNGVADFSFLEYPCSLYRMLSVISSFLLTAFSKRSIIRLKCSDG